MKSQFSEFTYGYTLVEELSRGHRFSAVPIFPSLVEEGKIGGYDVSIELSGLPFFLQFKRSDCLVRSNAKYYSLFDSSYYRFDLHALKYSQQHSLLLQLELSGNPVFYVAPKFHKNTELHDKYFNSSIASGSIWIAPLQIGNLLDDKEHSICFNSTATQVYFCSDPRLIEYSINNGADEITEYLNAFKKQRGDESLQSHRDTWETLCNQMEDILRTYDGAIYNKILKKIQREEDVVIKTARIARLAFGADIMIYNQIM